MHVVIICMEPYVGILHDRQAWNMRQRSRMPRKVVEKLLLTEENCRVVRMGRMPKLNAEEAAVDLIADMLRWEMALGEEPEAEADTSCLEILARCNRPLDVILSLPLSG